MDFVRCRLILHAVRPHPYTPPPRDRKDQDPSQSMYSRGGFYGGCGRSAVTQILFLQKGQARFVVTHIPQFTQCTLIIPSSLIAHGSPEWCFSSLVCCCAPPVPPFFTMRNAPAPSAHTHIERKKRGGGKRPIVFGWLSRERTQQRASPSSSPLTNECMQMLMTDV